jgi:hypothetical protein
MPTTRRALLTGLALVLAAAGAVAHWGNGGLFPCGRVDRLVGHSECEVLAVLDGQQLEAMAMAPDGKLLAVKRAPGRAPSERQQLLRFDPRDGRLLSRTTLPDIAPRTSWLHLAVSPSGRRVAGGYLHEPMRVFDVASGRTLRTFDGPASETGFLNDDVVLAGRRYNPKPPKGTIWTGYAQAYSVSTAARTKSPPAARWLFSRGVGEALSPSGAIVALEAGGSGGALVFLLRSSDGRRVRGLTGQIDDTDPTLPQLAFSPNGRLLAASFWAADRWFQEPTALFVWDTASGRLLHRLATRDQWRGLTWLADSSALLAERYDAGARRTQLMRLRVARP